MALTATPIRIAQQEITAANTDILIYTVAQPKVIIKEINIYSQKAQNKTLSLAIVPNGETLGVQHYCFLNGNAIGLESNIFTGLSMVCETGDTIYISGNSTGLYVYISGVEFTEIV